ncbi:hypothetical protein SSP531S_34260 [Streptomyces spongiicola]|uniref:Uncharacterized protein n=1 Tax=Streptomyces spongiicola TaxID=1690221 RepID=A0A388T068_9ACTN|nr:hypothetical protein SSP531S_34260 [Streptomyces spongiicola]
MPAVDPVGGAGRRVRWTQLCDALTGPPPVGGAVPHRRAGLPETPWGVRAGRAGREPVRGRESPCEAWSRGRAAGAVAVARVVYGVKPAHAARRAPSERPNDA